MTQTEGMIQDMFILEPDIQQLHQYDWSSGCKKGLEGRLEILSMTFLFGGKGEK